MVPTPQRTKIHFGPFYLPPKGPKSNYQILQGPRAWGPGGVKWGSQGVPGSHGGPEGCEVTTKPVSEELFVLELQSSWTVASRAHSGESSAGRADGAAECARLCGAELADGKRTQTALDGLCTPPCNIPTPPTFTCALLGAYAGYSPTWLVARVPQETG